MSIDTVLNSAYKKEKDVNIKERILLVKRVKIDKQNASSVAENELNRSRWWAYKWLHRFDKEGLDGLKDKERSGRPPDVPKDVMIKIRQELADSNTGWNFRQVMDLISSILSFTLLSFSFLYALFRTALIETSN